MKRLTDKAIAALLTLAFMWAVRPDPDPSPLGVAIVALLMYETILWCMKYVRKTKRRKEKEEYIAASRRDIQRWANEWIKWPLREVG